MNDKAKSKRQKRQIKKEKTGRGKNILILFLLLIVFSGIAYYFYQDRIDNTVSELPYPSEVVYDFETDVIGTHPEGWSGVGWDGTEIITWEGDELHGQVAELMNRDGEGVELATRFKKAERGVIEFDIYCDYDEIVNIDICQLTEEYDSVDDIIIHLGGSDNDIKIKDGNGIWTKISRFSTEKWYHFKIEFNLEYWELWIDGNYESMGYNFNHYEVPPYFCELYFSTYVDDNRFYVDNVEITVVSI